MPSKENAPDPRHFHPNLAQRISPDADELVMLRARYAGMPVRKAVERYLPDCIGTGKAASSVACINRWRRSRGRSAVRNSALFLSTRMVSVWGKCERLRTLRARDISTLADLTAWIPRRRQSWNAIPGLGLASAGASRRSSPRTRR